MKDNKKMTGDRKMAIICWVLSFLFLGGSVLTYEGKVTPQVFLDGLLTIVWAFTGFRYWQRREQEI